jgi:DNA-binding GntR family transcriptional regulator
LNAPVEIPRRQARRGSRREQLSEEVATHLRAAIMSGTLRPGTFIRLDDTAAQLGVSITPVREALLTLRGEGMVQLEPHRGHVVVPLSRQDIQDIFWLQATIAKELAAAAATHITDDQIDELELINDTLAESVAAGNTEKIMNAEFSFHRAFNRAAGRVKLSWFLLHAARYMPPLTYAADEEWGAGAIDHHRRLIAALRARDIGVVTEITEWQFIDGAKRLTQTLEKTGMWD